LKNIDNTYKQVFTKAKPNFATEGGFAGFIGSCIELDTTVKEALIA
jgi:hypothetical protein